MLVEKIQILRRVLHLPAVKHCCIEDPPAGSGRIHIFRESARMAAVLKTEKRTFSATSPLQTPRST